MEMTNEECCKLLKQYAKWRRGKGRKYAIPNCPINETVLLEAIDKAVECVVAVNKTQKLFDKEPEQ